MHETRIDKKIVVHWVGLDVSKTTFDAGLLAQGRLGEQPDLGHIPAKQFARTPQGVQAFLAWLDRHSRALAGPVRCVMETTGRYSEELALWLLAHRPCLAPAIVHAKHTAHFIKSLGVRNQTDALAARALALYGLHRQPEAFEPPSPIEHKLREVSRFRHNLVTRQTALKNQANEHSESAFVRRMQDRQLRQLAKDIKRTEAEMRTLLERMPDLKEDVALFETIYGVGFLTAAVVRCEMGDLNRFEKARQLTAYAGLNPYVHQSGSSVRKKTRIGKQGNKRVRAVLHMAARAAVRGDNDFARDYHRLISKGMKPMAALGVIMRKLLLVMRAVLIHRTPYEPHRKSGGKQTEICTIQPALP